MMWRSCAGVAGLALWPQTAWAQCAMCRTALEGLDAKLTAAFQSGVLFLFAAPFVVFGVVTLLAVRDARRRSVCRHQM